MIGSYSKRGIGLRCALGGVVLLATISRLWAADLDSSLQARLSSDRLGHLEPGTYEAGEKGEFELGVAGSKYLLRSKGSVEVFVLAPDSAAMGGRILRYDSGETAIQVSGWGGVTFYTDANPQGLPAVRSGGTPTFAPSPASADDIRVAALDLGEAMNRAHRMNVGFSVNWSTVPDTSVARARTLDALENIARGIERLGHFPQWRQAIARRICEITLAKGETPAVTLSGKNLLITFNPDTGYEGRASSRAIATALGTLLGSPQKQS